MNLKYLSLFVPASAVLFSLALVSPAVAQSLLTTNQTDQCEDRGGFPWGWNPVTLTSCRLDEQSTGGGVCLDSDGDGFGWNGVATCLLSGSIDPGPSTIAIPSQTTLLPDQFLSVPDNSSSYGTSLASDGDRVLVGSSDNVFFYNVANATILEATLPVSRRPVDLAISGNTAVIGQNGAVTVFEKDNSGWSWAAEIVSPFVGASICFGCFVAIDNNYMVVSAKRNSSSGSAYVYERIGGVWNQVSALAASDGTDLASSTRVAISGDTIVVGALSADGVVEDTGAAYIFERIDGSWTEQAKIIASDGIRFDQFGKRVAINGNTLLISHSLRPDSMTQYQDFRDADTVYAYQRSASGSWELTEKIATSTPSSSNRFGSDLSLFDNKALIGEADSGRAYLYSFQNGTWSLNNVLEVWLPSPSATNLVALSSDHALVTEGRPVTIGNAVNLFRLQLLGVCVDSDGDGWGWDGSKSCRVTAAPCIDTDGDGWGWDGSDSCRIE